MRMKLRLTCVVLLCALAACSDDFLQTLQDAEYPLDVTSTGKAQLVGGVFEEPAAPGSASMVRVVLGELRVVGDLDGDGSDDAAAILVADLGGSGTFSYLAAVLDRDGAAVPVATTLLGDRIVVESLVVRSGRIVVGLLTRGPEEAMAAEPTVAVELVFELRGAELVEVR